MNITTKVMNNKQYDLINFNHLMMIYEFNYQMIHNLFQFNFRSKRLSTFVANHQVLQYEPIMISKYTSIFKLYYKFWNNFFRILIRTIYIISSSNYNRHIK